MTEAQKKNGMWGKLSNLATFDGWQNIVTGLGTSRDKRNGARIVEVPHNVDPDKWMRVYTSDDIAATIADLPAGEMVREWFQLIISEEDEDGDDIRTEESAEERLSTTKDIMSKLDDIDAKQAFQKALVWSRVYGSGLILVGADDGGELEDPLAHGPHPLDHPPDGFQSVGGQDQHHVPDPRLPNFGQPETYTLQATTETGKESIAASVVHASRFLRVDGVLTPRRRMSRNGGWPDSVYARIETVLQDYGTAWGLSGPSSPGLRPGGCQDTGTRRSACV